MSKRKPAPRKRLATRRPARRVPITVGDVAPPSPPGAYWKVRAVRP